MRGFADILGRLFYPEDVDPGEDGDASGPPDPLDDYSQVSIHEVKVRSYGRNFFLIVLSRLLPLLLIIFVGIGEILSSPSSRNEALVIVLLIVGCYLILVRFDTGRWGLVHPLLTQLPQAYQYFRRESDVFQLVVGLDLLLVVAIILFVLSGWVFLKNGINFLLMFIGIGLFLNIAIVMWYAIEPPGTEPPRGEFF